MSNYYSVHEVSELEKIPYHKIIRLIKRGEYPGAHKVGWGWVIPKEDVVIKKPKKKIFKKRK